MSVSQRGMADTTRVRFGFTGARAEAGGGDPGAVVWADGSGACVAESEGARSASARP